MNRVVLKPFDKDKFELIENYSYECEFGVVDIPSGYKTNGANIPRAFWSFYPPNSPEYLSAVVVHDYLCDKAYKNNKSYEDFILADNIFFIALKELDINNFKSALFYNSCRFYHYLKYKVFR